MNDPANYCPVRMMHGHNFQGPPELLDGVAVKHCVWCGASQVTLTGGLGPLLQALAVQIGAETCRLRTWSTPACRASASLGWVPNRRRAQIRNMHKARRRDRNRVPTHNP